MPAPSLAPPAALLAALALVAVAPRPAAAAEEVWVDAVAGDDATGDGSAAAPYRTLTRGVQDLVGAVGDRVLRVEPGLYDAAIGEAFPVVLPEATQLLGAGSRHTVVSGVPGEAVLRIDDHVLVSDITVRRGAVGIESPGDCFSIAGPTRFVRRCEVHHNAVGVLLRDCPHSDHGVAVVNSRVTENGVGVRLDSTDFDFQSVTLILHGSTVTANGLALESTGNGFERFYYLFDSILVGNGDDTLPVSEVLGQSGNVVGDPALVGLAGTVGGDPRLVGPGDVHLRLGSPALDLAAPAAPWPPAPVYVGPGPWKWEGAFADVRDLDGGPRVVGAAPDAGADERRAPTVYASAPPFTGDGIALRLQAGALEPVVVAVSGAVLPAPLPPGIWLAPPVAIVGAVLTDADGVGGIPVDLPAGASWVGVDVHLQAATVLPALAVSDLLRLRLLP